MSCSTPKGGSTPSADAELAYGVELAPGYRVLSLLSRGDAFETYDAWSEQRFSRCVVKTVREDRPSRAHHARLLREGTLVTTSDHPHLVRGYEVGTRPRPFVAMETLTGATLGHLIDLRSKPLAVADVALLGSQLCSVLRFLHGRGVLHLDVKPDNVVIEGARAKLLDLSLAHPPGVIEAALGTPGYMAPEQAAGGQIGEPADVWGLAVTLYQAATGFNPFRPPARRPSRSLPSLPSRPTLPSLPTLGSEASSQVRAPAVASRRRLPREVGTAIDTALDPEPTNRPTMLELDAILNQAAGAALPSFEAPADPA